MDFVVFTSSDSTILSDEYEVSFDSDDIDAFIPSKKFFVPWADKEEVYPISSLDPEALSR